MDGITPQRWVEFFKLCGEQPLLFEADLHLIRALAENPEEPVGTVIADALPPVRDDWHTLVDGVISSGYTAFTGDSIDRRRRHHLGAAMESLRGRIAVAEVRQYIEKHTADIQAGAD